MVILTIVNIIRLVTLVADTFEHSVRILAATKHTHVVKCRALVQVCKKIFIVCCHYKWRSFLPVNFNYDLDSYIKIVKRAWSFIKKKNKVNSWLEVYQPHLGKIFHQETW